MTRWMALAFATFVPLGLALALTLGGAACIDAIGSDGGVSGLQGGGALDGVGGLMMQSPPTPNPCTDAGEPGNSCTGAGTCCGIIHGTAICAFNGNATGVCTTIPQLGTGHTWSELYADYFGGTGRATCAGNGSCHGTTSGAGFASSQYVCPPDDKDACYKSMLSASAGLITSGQTLENDFLYQAIRKEAAVGLNNMPLEPVQIYTFTPTDLARISAWVAAGAPND
jgi:hypothetical protein